MTKTLRTHRLAEEELADAASWYETKQPGLGLSFLDLIDDVVDRVLSGTLPSSPVPEVKVAKDVRRVLLKRFPYSIVFYEREHENCDHRFRSQQQAAWILALARVVIFINAFHSLRKIQRPRCLRDQSRRSDGRSI